MFFKLYMHAQEMTQKEYENFEKLQEQFKQDKEHFESIDIKKFQELLNKCSKYQEIEDIKRVALQKANQIS